MHRSLLPYMIDTTQPDGVALVGPWWSDLRRYKVLTVDVSIPPVATQDTIYQYFEE